MCLLKLIDSVFPMSSLEGFAHSAAADGEKSSAGQAEQPNEAAIWTCVFACPSPGGDVELRLCMFERRRWLADGMDLLFYMFQRLWAYGVTFMHV